MSDPSTPSPNSRAAYTAWLAQVKAQGGPVTQGGAIAHADAKQAPEAEKTGLAVVCRD